jgi:VWFA-related protein
VRLRVALFLSFLAALALAARSANQSATQGETVLRVETRLIEVNVIAQDSKGHAATSLTRDDFKLFDNGKEIPIDVFSAISAESAPVTSPLPPNTFSNRIQGAPPSVTAILLDGLNTSFADQTWARTEVVRFLEELRPQDRVAIFLLGDHLYLLQNFTSDPKALLEVLKSSKARVPRELAASAPRETPPGATQPVDIQTALQQLTSSLPSGPGGGGGSAPSTASVQAGAAANAQAQAEAIMLQFETHSSSFFVMDRVARTMAALIAIANYVAQFPGRKNLIWVSAGFPIAIGFDQPRAPGDTRDQVHFTPELERAFKALNNADLAVYPVDARGLVASDGAAATRSGDTNVNDFYSSHGTMDELADHTGGRAFYNSNDLAGVIQRALDDSQADYTLGFYPHHISWDGQYHELKVKVTRPGIHLRYRKGYYAALDTPNNDEQTAALLKRALYSPLDSTGLGLNVTVQKVFKEPPKKVVLRISMDAHNITFQDRNGDKTVELEMLFSQAGADGSVLNTFQQSVNMRIAGRGMDVILNRGLTMGKWVGLVDGATSLEIVVRDSASGNTGSLRIPLGS